MTLRFDTYAGSTAAAHAILEDCGRDLEQRLGLCHWAPAYPAHLLERDAEQGRLWSLREAGDLLGVVTLSSDPPAYYRDVLWDVSTPALYITRLAIRPGLQGAGHGSTMMRCIEQHARRSRFDRLRLDACVAQPSLLEWYTRLGFVRHGSYRAGPSSEGEFAFLERVLRATG